MVVNTTNSKLTFNKNTSNLFFFQLLNCLNLNNLIFLILMRKSKIQEHFNFNFSKFYLSIWFKSIYKGNLPFKFFAKNFISEKKIDKKVYYYYFHDKFKFINYNYNVKLRRSLLFDYTISNYNELFKFKNFNFIKNIFLIFKVLFLFKLKQFSLFYSFYFLNSFFTKFNFFFLVVKYNNDRFLSSVSKSSHSSVTNLLSFNSFLI